MEFKFDIGQVVQHKASGVRVCVTARLVEESKAGKWPVYFASGHDRGDQMHRLHYYECELEPAKPSTLADSLAWVKELAVSEHDFESAAAVRDLVDKLTKRRRELGKQ